MESSNEVHEAADELPTVTVDFGTADGSATWFVESGIDAVAETLTAMLGPRTVSSASTQPRLGNSRAYGTH